MFDLASARDVLSRTPATLRALVGGISPGWTITATRDGSWRAFDVVGHLIQGEEEDWIPRTRIILEHGQDEPFPRFDRGGFERVTAGKDLAQLLDDFEALRVRNLRMLDEMRLDERLLDKKGTHPEFGPVTLRQIIATWTAHDLSHVGQIADSMARRYRDDVGPWRGAGSCPCSIVRREVGLGAASRGTATFHTMGSRIGSTVLNVTDIARAAAFWTHALGYVRRDSGSADETFVVLRDPARAWSNLSLQLTDQPKSGLNRVHLDLYTEDQEAEVARLVSIGARRVEPWDYEPGDDHIVMADPDGNEFCIVQLPR
jgi:catechol 2,3-dioxygenase-like lactoylglutathione lyase family enzyme